MPRRCWLLLVLAAIMMPAQQDQSSAIEGFVTSDVAAVIPNTRVGVDSLIKGSHREVVTDTSGYYIVRELRPGASVWAEVKGLGCLIYPHVAIVAGQRVRQDFHFARAKQYPGHCEPLQKR